MGGAGVTTRGNTGGDAIGEDAMNTGGGVMATTPQSLVPALRQSLYPGSSFPNDARGPTNS